MRDFVSLLGRERRNYAIVALCAAAVTGSEALLHPLLLKAIFDAVSGGEDFSRFVYLGGAYFLLGLSVNILTYFVSLWKLRVDNRVVADASHRLLEAYYNKDYGDVLREGSGYYVARIRSDVKDGLVPMLVTVRDVFVSIVTFVLLISVLLYLSWQAFAVLAVIIPVSTFVSIRVGKRIRMLTGMERDFEAALMDVLARSVGAFKMVRTFSLVPAAVASFSGSVDRSLASNYSKFRVVRLLQGAGDLTMVVSDVCSIFVGAYFVFLKQMTLGSFIAFMNAFWRSATTLIEVFNRWAEVHGHMATIDRLVSFMREAPAQPYHAASTRVCAGGIAYAYGDQQVLSDFSMCARGGERTLVVGRNGTGKTTVANILCGHLYPSRGALELPARISGVTLPVHFPPALVRELPIEPELLRMFAIDDPVIIASRPDFLSAGQQQKIALALVLSMDADLYVLDEPLANLDTASRALAMQEILRRTAGRILVMIMHDADAYRGSFDQVLTLGEA